MIFPWESAIESVTGLISELTIDDDKQAEIRLELERLKVDVRKQLLNTTTTPKTDAAVKLMIAFRDIILPLLRPLGAACMTAFAAYCAYSGVELAGATEAMLVGAFPAWGASRHVHKSKKIDKPEREEWDDD